jgi:hypothetical protein
MEAKLAPCCKELAKAANALNQQWQKKNAGKNCLTDAAND